MTKPYVPSVAMQRVIAEVRDTCEQHEEDWREVARAILQMEGRPLPTPADARTLSPEPKMILFVWKCATCGCLWRDNLDETVSLLDTNQKSCQTCEWKSTSTACQPFALRNLTLASQEQAPHEEDIGDSPQQTKLCLESLATGLVSGQVDAWPSAKRRDAAERLRLLARGNSAIGAVGAADVRLRDNAGTEWVLAASLAALEAERAERETLKAENQTLREQAQLYIDQREMTLTELQASRADLASTREALHQAQKGSAC